MAALIPQNFQTVTPTEADALLARESSRRLATHKLDRRSSVRIQVLDDEAEAVVVPASALRLFLHLLTEMSQGNAVTLGTFSSDLSQGTLFSIGYSRRFSSTPFIAYLFG